MTLQNGGMADHLIPLFLDCDPGIDDALAIAYLLCQDDVDVLGIAASGGNVATAQVAHNARGWLELAGRADIPVHAGATHPLAHPAVEADAGATLGAGHGEAMTWRPAPEPEYAEETHGDLGCGYAQLPEPTATPPDRSAAEAWVEAARAHPGELIGVLIGPATNLALALDLEPDFPRLLKRLFVMGGAFNYRGNTHPTTEWNVTYDPEATARVVEAFGSAFTSGASEHPPVIAPIEATEAVIMTPERMSGILSGTDDADGRPRARPGSALADGSTPGEGSALADSPAPADGSWPDVVRQLGEALRFYFEFHQGDGHGYLAHVHDPFVLAVALEWARTSQVPLTADSREATEPAKLPWSESARAPVDVELTGTLTRGETVADWLGRWNKPANAEIIRRIDADHFLNHLSATLTRGPRP